MTASERRQEILNLINKEGSLRASDLAERMGVTSETIRKDLIYLNNKKLLKKCHGSAHAINEFIERSVDLRTKENTAAKRAIAKKAIEQIADSMVIFIDAGSTMVELAKLLGLLPQLAIITNSFSVVEILQNTGNTIYFIGGEVSNVTQATNGFWAANELRSIRIDIAFLGTSGFQSHTGPCTKYFSDTQLKKEVINNSNKTIVLADHTKFVSNAIIQYADWIDIDLLITDKNVKEEHLKALSEDVDIIIADAIEAG